MHTPWMQICVHASGILHATTSGVDFNCIQRGGVGTNTFIEGHTETEQPRSARSRGHVCLQIPDREYI